MNKLHLFGYGILLSIITFLGCYAHHYKSLSLEQANTINALELDIHNTKLNLDAANHNIEDANNQLKRYIDLNNKMNEQLVKFKNSRNIAEDIEDEVRQINCMFINIDKEGDCINGEFIEN